jgi:hypothetical protein
MLYRPAHELGWDTWIVPHEGRFLMYYIRITPGRERVAPAPSLGEGWDGVSLASSDDLLHWTEEGPVLEAADDAAWLGTGMIHQVDGRYIMNVSEERPVGQQVIAFAESSDLRSWKRLPRTFDLRPDGANYQASPENSADPLPRWDSLGVARHPEGGFVAFICANTTRSLPGRCGTLGSLRSDDGLRWRHQAPLVEPGWFPSYEVPEHIEFDNRHYVLFCTNSTAGPRFEPGTITAHSGTYYVVADRIDGPYRPPQGDPLLLGNRDRHHLFGTYVGRPLRLGSDVLFYHQWTASYPEAWYGPPKRLVERRPGELGLDYWPSCEGLKGEALFGDDPSAWTPLPAAGAVPVIEWLAETDGIRAMDRGGTHGVHFDVRAHRGSTGPADLADGRVVEATLRLESGRGLGLWFGSDASAATGVLLNYEAERVEFGPLIHDVNGASERFEPVEWRSHRLEVGVDTPVRALVRRRFLEVYVGDRLVHCQILAGELDVDRLGIFAELATGVCTRPRVWAMA